MKGIVTERNLFRPKPSKAATKADITDHAARAIISVEIERREAKTARLRQARLESEAQQVATPPPATQRRTKGR
jgi:hypothetical protein